MPKDSKSVVKYVLQCMCFVSVCVWGVCVCVLGSVVSIRVFPTGVPKNKIWLSEKC